MLTNKLNIYLIIFFRRQILGGYNFNVHFISLENSKDLYNYLFIIFQKNQLFSNYKSNWLRFSKMIEERVEATITFSQDQSGITTKLWRNYPEQTTEQQQERSLISMNREKNHFWYNLSGKECGGD